MDFISKKILETESIGNLVTVIIRSVGERTESLTRSLIIAQGVPEKNVLVIRDAPFSMTLRKSFEQGIIQGRPWTFCVDADVLLRQGSVLEMLSVAERQNPKVFEMQGYILDKFFGGVRGGGVHLYRTELLNIALSEIPNEGLDIRPEYHTIKAMVKLGYYWKNIYYVVGLHDFEQYYSDIYRKACVYAHKHVHRSEPLLTFWRNNINFDKDYSVALFGFARGIEHAGPLSIDVTNKAYLRDMRSLGIEEKQDIKSADFSLEYLEKLMMEWNTPSKYKNNDPLRLDMQKSNSAKFSNRFYGVMHGKKRFFRIGGWLMHKLGDKLHSLG